MSRSLTKRIETLYSYLIVGLMNTTICFMAMYLGALSGLDYLSYTALGYIIAILFSFFMNLRYTFRVKGDTLKRLVLFIGFNLINLLFVEIIEHVLIESFALNKILAILCGMGWYIVVGFLLNSFFVYRKTLEVKP
jgi:putative flippase GtrA